ncbi:MAK10-like protein [Tanacetum coccineum]
MGDNNPIRTLGDYSKPSHEGYRNTIELPIGNNVVPLRSNTIRLVQNGCSFYGLPSEDPNQHLKDFLKFVDSLDLDDENRERMRLRLFQFSLRDQASNLLECLPAGSISTWEDLTTRFLAQFFSPGRTTKLRNDILMFQQHHGESLSEAWTLQKFYDHVNPVIKQTIDQSAGGKLRDLNAEESWALLEDLALYDNESWNDSRDFTKPVKAIALPQDVPSISDRRLIELENQVQRLMEVHLTSTQPTQVNKITTSCEICSGPHDTQYCMEDPEQAFVEYASSRTDEVGEGLVSEFMASQDARLSKFEVDFKRQQGEGATTEEPVVEYFDTFSTRDELTYHRYLMSGPIPSIFLRNPIITEGCPYNLKIPCNIGHVHIKKAYIDLNSPLNIITRMMYNWIMRRKLDPRENASGISNFTERIKGMHVFVGNFTYVIDFMIVDDISSIIDPRLSQVVLGGAFVEISNMTYDPPKCVVRFIKGVNEVAYKMPHKIEQYYSFLDLEKVHIKSICLRNKEDKRRGVEYVMSKILGFYKEFLELGPEYLTGMDDDGEVTLYLMRRSLEVLRKFHWMILGGRFNQLSHVSSLLLSKPVEYHAEGRKSGTRLFGGHFIGRLAAHFGLVSDQGLRGLSVVISELSVIDLDKLARLNICSRFGDTWAWVAPGTKRQHTATAGAPGAAEDAPAADEGAQAVLALVQAPQLPPPAPQPRTMSQRIDRLEEKVCELRQSVVGL